MGQSRPRERASTRFRSLIDSDLVELLYTSGDRLPREAVDEFLRRGPKMLPRLHSIVAEKSSWTQPLPEWWASVHASYILGSMEDSAALLSLLMALRWADAFECDWVTEDLPSMFGRIGLPAYEPLRAVADDATAGWGARSIAISGLLAAEEEDLYLRQTSANILLDFQAVQYRELLAKFGEEESARKQEDPEYRGVFYDWELEEVLTGEGTAEDLEYYQREWLVFYEPEEVERRQQRWDREATEAGAEVPEEEGGPRQDITAPCSCGSGKPFDRCCYLKVH
jgi:hypothetical protein